MAQLHRDRRSHLGLRCLIDSALASGNRSGYLFHADGMQAAHRTQAYNLSLSPVCRNYSGIRYFCSFADAVVRFSMTTITTCDNSVSPQHVARKCN